MLFRIISCQTEMYYDIILYADFRTLGINPFPSMRTSLKAGPME